tara:strand:+ start:1056 stop:2057 length:1002 start_codon:yes stop_codon:yes gene_type:complete
METVKALIHFLDNHEIAYKKCAVFAAPFDHALGDVLEAHKCNIYSYDYEASQKWEANGFNVSVTPDSIDDPDLTIVFPDKNHEQSAYIIQKAFESLNDKGVLIAVAHNLAGGKRLSKIIKDIGGNVMEETSKNHCRVVLAAKSEKMTEPSDALYKNDFGYWSQAGLFGHEKIDKGSSIMLQNIGEKVNGVIADFGCGYGYISCEIAATDQHDIDKIYAYDNDYRAVKCCEKNLSEKGKDVEFEVKWFDLTQAPETDFFDTILLNPPFHTGKKTDISLGKTIIESAAKSLKKRGVIYIVANTHLPYEAVLKHAGISFDIVATEQGFKVFKGVKQ